MADRDQVFFQSIPWCAKILDEPNTIMAPIWSRQYKQSTEDALFAETLNTDHTIQACLSFYKRPPAGVTHVTEVHALVSLGYGVNGYPRICHGGIVATIMDEVMGVLVTVNKKENLENATLRTGTVTAYLNVTYLKPVATPQTVHVTAKSQGVKAPKHYIEASVKDGNGTVLAKAEALWVAVSGSKANL